MMPVSTAATATYSTVQITSDAMIPIGRSRRGFFASSAVVDTASKPMYAKKTTAAPLMTPDQAYGMKGVQFAGSTYQKPATRKKSTAAILIVTMTALNFALSRIPTIRRTMIASTISIAGRLMSAPGAAAGAALIQTGRCTPKPARIRWR